MTYRCEQLGHSFRFFYESAIGERVYYCAYCGSDRL